MCLAVALSLLPRMRILTSSQCQFWEAMNLNSNLLGTTIVSTTHTDRQSHIVLPARNDRTLFSHFLFHQIFAAAAGVVIIVAA